MPFEDEFSERPRGFWLREMFGVFLLFLTVLLLMSLLSYSPSDPSLNHALSRGTINNLCGPIGAYTAGFLNDLFGSGSLLLPLIMGGAGLGHLSRRFSLDWLRWLGCALISFSILVFVTALDISIGDLRAGGMIGRLIWQEASRPLLSQFGAGLLWFFIFLTGVQLFVALSWRKMADRLGAFFSRFIVRDDDEDEAADNNPDFEFVRDMSGPRAARLHRTQTASDGQLQQGQTGEEPAVLPAQTGLLGRLKRVVSHAEETSSLPALNNGTSGQHAFLPAQVQRFTKPAGLHEEDIPFVSCEDSDVPLDHSYAEQYAPKPVRRREPEARPRPAKPRLKQGEAQDKPLLALLEAEEPASAPEISADALPELTPAEDAAGETTPVHAAAKLGAGEEETLPAEEEGGRAGDTAGEALSEADALSDAPETSGTSAASGEAESSDAPEAVEEPVPGELPDELPDRLSDTSPAAAASTVSPVAEAVAAAALQAAHVAVAAGTMPDSRAERRRRAAALQAAAQALLDEDPGLFDDDDAGDTVRLQEQGTMAAGAEQAAASARNAETASLEADAAGQTAQKTAAASSAASRASSQSTIRSAVRLKPGPAPVSSAPSLERDSLFATESSMLPDFAEEDEDEADAADDFPTRPARARIVRTKAPKPAPRRQSAQTRDGFYMPPLELLEKPAGDDPEIQDEELEDCQDSLMHCLADFGIQADLVRATPGPVVTTYMLRPAAGVSVRAFLRHTDDIARSLMAVSVFIQAPVPGTDTVGIVIPNRTRAMVNFREIAEDAVFAESSAALPLIVGKDTTGQPFVSDLAKMPHLLVAGATGQGKSVCLNAMLTSLLLRKTPNELKLLLVDPKRVEMGIYEDESHLVHPVVKEVDDAKNALLWAVREMDQRYSQMSRLYTKNIQGYNAKLASYKGNLPPELADLEPMPYIVIVIDELADLMLQARKDVEPCIIRLAQLARACGIHMIIATQRPSVDVVTGLIKANFPSRICFRVSSRQDSITTLGQAGAEKLLGNGDMFFNPNGGHLIRLHGPFLRDEEVQSVVDFWKKQAKPKYQVDFATFGQEEEESPHGGKGSASNVDAMYEDVIEFCKEKGYVSISLLQRRFSIGFNKAARYMDQLDRDGLVGPSPGAGKPRPVLFR